MPSKWIRRRIGTLNVTEFSYEVGKMVSVICQVLNILRDFSEFSGVSCSCIY